MAHPLSAVSAGIMATPTPHPPLFLPSTAVFPFNFEAEDLVRVGVVTVKRGFFFLYNWSTPFFGRRRRRRRRLAC
jgi:hypothetical protein